VHAPDGARKLDSMLPRPSWTARLKRRFLWTT